MEEELDIIQRLREEQGRCKLCGGVLMVKNGKMGHFKACVNFPKCYYARELTPEEREKIS